MAPRQLIPGVVFQPRSHQGLQRGINHMVDVVRPTLGPLPRLVGVENTFRDKTPEFLDSAGVITRRIIQLPDRDADMGAMLVRHVLWRLHDEVRDGTATAAVILQAVFNEGLRYVSFGGDALQLRRYLERGLRVALEELDRQTVQIDGKERLSQLAASLCADPPLARLLGEIFDIVGEYGQVDIRKDHRRDLGRQYIEGMYWRSSMVSPYMFRDQTAQRTDLENAAILISDLELEDPRQLMPVLDMALDAEIRALLIVANKLSDSSIALLLAASREPEKFQVIAAQTPGQGKFEQADAMEDLAILTGGRPLLQVAGDTLRGLRVEDFGHARRAWVDRLHLGVIGGKGNPRRLREHVMRLRAQFQAAEDRKARTALQQRIGKLIGGSAILSIGGNSEVEITAREELARRTAEGLRAALRGGVLPGGGSALLACIPRLRCMLEVSDNPDELAAYRILIAALSEPLRAITANAGYDPGAIMFAIDQAGAGFGCDVRCGQVVNMAQAGILDIAPVQKAALESAVLGAATALTVDILVHKKKPKATPGRP